MNTRTNTTMNTLRTLDMAPLFRQAVGFDRLSRMLDSAMKIEQTAPSYPPYNIMQKDEDTYRITLAVAGFGSPDLSVVAQENTLMISGKQAKAEDEAADAGKYLHQGIAARAFERRFQLADHVKVTSAKLENGLLHIDLAREVPEAAKPRAVTIETAGSNTVLDQKTH